MTTEENKIERILKLEQSEIVLLGLIIFVSGYMLVKSFSFSTAVQRFPLIFSTGTLVGSVVLLFRSFLPGVVHRFVTGSQQVLSEEKDRMDDDEPEETDQQKIYLTISFIIGHGVLSVLISILYATPVFVALHTIWTRKPWYITVGLSTGMLGVGYLFIEYLQVPLGEGILIGGGL